jgi:hypothetical protein
MKTYTIPNLKEIMKPRWEHKPGYGMNKEYVLHKRKSFEQSTTPKDSELLKKLGIKRGEKVLTIASYYASWASEIAKAGAKVDYSDISQSLTNWAKKKYKKLFGKYIHSGYEVLPKQSREYDWTFTYEACGGGSGLPIAYLRSLLNNKGGILVLLLDKENPNRMGSKLKRYPNIVRKLSEIYSADCSLKKIRIKSHRIDKPVKMNNFMISKIKTNEKARKLATQDLLALSSNKFSDDNLKRLTKFSKMISKEFLKKMRKMSVI